MAPSKNKSNKSKPKAKQAASSAKPTSSGNIIKISPASSSSNGQGATSAAAKTPNSENLFSYFSGVKQEFGKVKFPDFKSTSVTTGIVPLVMLIAVLFFGVADNLISWLVKLFTGY